MTERLDLLTLRVVVAVAESGSISAGSDRLQLAVAAASARISSLEAALGVRIFERSPRGVELTPAGHMLVQRGRELLGDADQLATDLRHWSLGLAGHVRMLANASSLLELLPPRLEAFMREHPRIHVEIEERVSPEILVALVDGRADIGVVDADARTPGLEFLPSFQDDLGVVLPRAHPLAGERELRLQQLLAENFIVLAGANTILTRLFNAAAMLGQPINVRMQMRSFDAACRMVAAGLGAAVLPMQAIAPQLAHLPLAAVPVAEEWARRTHFLALRAGDQASAAARTLAAALRAPRG
ncbi:MAG TPA: LysR substrate-binding domain-containing protein [Ramlibacter sp.]|uniref:LysR substrate-binding domain-containing protein n=1 Tax=Ramlibacter sp. TaxID=1917967 RepID=UPI002D7E897D|nr:LysR substrate-binding domain-containing protein [Ramlibacter sp.]HET8745088.1 LysR substrate-binding domain-containing protein [Ramlibacter sp.]